MINQKKYQIEISVIGCGIAGITTALHLGEKGYKVNLIDPTMNSTIDNLNPLNGTQASLGVLMGNSYKRSQGRSFLLRNRSMQLWKEWLKKLNYDDLNLKIEKPLIKIANSEREYQSMINICRKKKGYNIELLDNNSINFWSNIFEKKVTGGMISKEDGRINPIKLINLLMKKVENLNINKINDKVISLTKNNDSSNKNWDIHLEKHESMRQNYIVICSSLNTQKLLNPLGHTVLLEPILGQVIELKLKESEWDKWPSIINYQSLNFIPNGSRHILIGATIEPGTKPNPTTITRMLDMNSSAPQWIQKGKIIRHWSGLRAKPANEPAPLLKELNHGLFINTGHYRNGILLAPACAEWIGKKIDCY